MAYIMNKSDGDFQQGGRLYKPNRGIMDTEVLMDIWLVSEKQTSQLLEVHGIVVITNLLAELSIGNEKCSLP